MRDWKYVWRTVGFDGWEQALEDGNFHRTSLSITDPIFETRDGHLVRTSLSVEDPVIEIRDVRHKLFNLANDPEERVDLVEEEPEMAAVMLDRLKQHQETMLDTVVELGADQF